MVLWIACGVRRDKRTCICTHYTICYLHTQKVILLSNHLYRLHVEEVYERVWFYTYMYVCTYSNMLYAVRCCIIKCTPTKPKPTIRAVRFCYFVSKAIAKRREFVFRHLPPKFFLKIKLNNFQCQLHILKLVHR